MSERFAGTYFDGENGDAHAAELYRVGASHFGVAGERVTRSGAIASLAITPRLARVARTIEFPDGARMLIAHDAVIDGWFAREGRMEAFVDRLEKHAYAVAIAIVVCAATLVVGARWGIPWLSDRIADKIPPDVERTLGVEVLSNLDRFGLASTQLAPARRNELELRFDKLAHDSGGEYTLEFRDAPRVGANAFSIPGGTIIVTDQLVHLMDDDREFDAVVAHEIGHQKYRHALRQTLRGSAVAIIAAFFAGDVSSASAVVIGVPTFLLDSHYSREFESEADRYSFELLSRDGESPHWFAEAMRNLEAQVPDGGELAYLSSHPTTHERIAAADAAAKQFAAAHPDLCPGGICPGESEDDADDDSDSTGATGGAGS